MQYVLLVLVNPVGDFHRSGLNPVAGTHLRTSMTTAGFIGEAGRCMHAQPSWPKTMTGLRRSALETLR